MTGRRGRARTNVALAASAALLAGCMTTHTLGPVDDPGTRAQVNALAAGGVDYVHLRTETPTNRPPFGYRFAGLDPAGVIVEPARGQSLVVPLSQVESVTRYDHWRGARHGAIAGGIISFAAGFVLAYIFQSGANNVCSQACNGQRVPPQAGLIAGAFFGLVGAVLGGALGAAVGYEDRFTIAPPK